MVLVINKSEPQTIYLPKNFSAYEELFDLEVYSLVSNYRYLYSGIVDEGFYNNWYCFTLDFSNLPLGEYQYKLRPKDTGLLGDFNLDFSLDFFVQGYGGNGKKELLSYGVLQIGTYKDNSREYQKGFKQKQYNPTF